LTKEKPGLIVEAMRHTTLPERLGQVLVKLAPGHPEVFDELRDLYAEDVLFHDPIQVVHGLPKFLAMNERLIARMKTLEWTILGTWGDDESACLEWNMKGRPKLGPELSVDGMTRISAIGGRITQHRDYWDLGELIASGIPFGPRVLRTVLRPIA
jgi:hypothetical protein